MAKLLVVSNCPSANARRLQEAVVRGAEVPGIDGVVVSALEPLQAHPQNLLDADGLILGTTENFGYMSGLVKDFLERIYYPCLEETQGLPVGLFIKGGLDGQGAKTSIQRIITGLRWREVQPALVMTGDFQDAFINQCEMLGTTMAAGLEAGIF